MTEMASPLSKPNRRKEIKEKEQLQARILFALAQNQKNIQSWLPPQKAEQKPDEDSSAASASFYDLPILPSGVGLSSLEGTSEQKFGKVGDFINADINKVKEHSIARSRQADSSPAMAALRNKIRDNSRKEVKKKYEEKRRVPLGRKMMMNSLTTSREHTIRADPDSDSDEEAMLVKNRSAKKWVQPMQKKKGRPF